MVVYENSSDKFDTGCHILYVHTVPMIGTACFVKKQTNHY